MQGAAAAVGEATARGDLDPKTLFKSLLQGSDAYFQDTAQRIGSDAKTLAFLAYNSILPSIELSAAQVASYLDTEAVWQKGYCPVCGSSPGLAVLNQEGQRVVVCSFCRHPWQAPRLFCVFCENRKSDELQYVFAEEESDLRIDVCERCRHYIKTVQGREVARPLYPPLEQVASLHLDMIAAEKGFRSGAGLTFEA
jgi:FdhE protein